jgi:hypothetical protein
MTTWFFKIEGKSDPNSEISYPFGFYVNCLLSTELGIEGAKKSILNDLGEDGYEVVNIEYSGEYKDYFWKNREILLELNELAEQSKRNLDTIYYSNFHIWRY